MQGSDHHRARGIVRAAVLMAGVVVLSACELMLSEPPPTSSAACSAWRGGCPAPIDFAGDAPTPTLRSENRLAANVRFAEAAPERACTIALDCQAREIGLVLQDQYFDVIGSP